jgi:peptidoglycan hydrolase CwlO-like protein
MQLRSSREKLEAANKMFEGVGELMTNLNNSVNDTKRYKENIATLSDNLQKLNTVYGNMLAAMQVRG